MATNGKKMAYATTILKQGRRFFDTSAWSGRLGRVLETDLLGADLLENPLTNKGSSFDAGERDRLAIRGLIPPRVFSCAQEAIDIQTVRVFKHLNALPTALDKHLALAGLLDRNETLFYKILSENLVELAPLIYTPTVGEACLNFAEKFTKARGMYFSTYDKGHMDAMVYNWPQDDVQVICVTDGSRILGLGDLGTNGMGIPIGKLSLYVACGGIHPSRVLPIMLDVGTNNQSLLDDPLYLGVREKRKEGAEYEAILDEFIRAVNHRWPWALIQFEDFSSNNALRILDRYKKSVMCFNDDIQGTGVVALSGILAGLKATGQMERTALAKQRIFVVGAGSAGCGIANSIHESMTYRGLSREKAQENFWMFDNDGLLGKNYQAVDSIQSKFVRQDCQNKMSLLEAIHTYKPTILIGVTACPGLFTDEILTAMCQYTERPLIFPLSNPTSRAECHPESVARISKGRAIFASGSPFENVLYDGKTIVSNQMNNMYCFPGLGLGAVTCLPQYISDEILQNVAESLANEVTPAQLAQGKIFPELTEIRTISRSLAWSVVKTARKQQIARKGDLPSTMKEFNSYLYQKTWRPQYATYVHRAIDRVNVHETILDLSEYGSSHGKSSFSEPW